MRPFISIDIPYLITIIYMVYSTHNTKSNMATCHTNINNNFKWQMNVTIEGKIQFHYGYTTEYNKLFVFVFFLYF